MNFENFFEKTLKEAYFNNLFRQILLQEKKDHLINKTNMSPEEKQTLIDFFKKHPNYESKFDWQKKDIKFEDFASIMQSQAESKSNIKNLSRTSDLTAIWNARKEKDFEILWHNETDIFVMPFSHDCCVFMNSFDCYGTGAKWCIGTKDSNKYWQKYIIDDSTFFIFHYSKLKNIKEMYEISANSNEVINTWNAKDKSSKFKVPKIMSLQEFKNMIEIGNRYSREVRREETKKRNLIDSQRNKTFKEFFKTFLKKNRYTLLDEYDPFDFDSAINFAISEFDELHPELKYNVYNGDSINWDLTEDFFQKHLLPIWEKFTNK
jgi:hypothetical protein